MSNSKFISAAVLILLTVEAVFADTTYVAPGNISGNWTPANSPYIVDSGDVTVPPGMTLTIAPGVSVLFTGMYKFTIVGTLIADGTESDSIIFTRAYPTEQSKWRGLRFDNSAANSSLSYCRIDYAKGEGAYPDVRGGAVWIDNCSVPVRHCLIANSYSHNGNYNGCGGGICLNENSNSLIEYNVIKLNQADSGAGVLAGSGCDPIIRFNVIEDNTAFYAGGGIYISANASSTISGNVVQGNISGGFGGGGINLWSATWLYGTFSNVYNNLIINNSATDAGGGIYSRYETSNIYNNTIAENFCARGGGVYVLTFANLPPNIYNDIIWDNTAPSGQSIFLDPAAGSTANISYCDVQGGWAGVGNIDLNPLFANGPQGSYYLSQIAAGQMAQSGCVDSGDPITPMITGATRTDCVQDAGVIDMGYHYELGGVPYSLVVGITPFIVPIQIPAGGGIFSYELSIANTGTTTAVFDGWINVILPDGSTFGPVILRSDLELTPAASIFRPDMTQAVPGNAPAGNYSYIAYVGDYPNTVVASDTIFFEKLGQDDNRNVDSWNLQGWDEEALTSAPVPRETLLISAYPNPFNAETTITFDLQTAAEVSLKVYDIAGREVQDLGFGIWDLGTHSVRWNAAGLPSGIYFYRIEAGGLSAIGKCILLK